MEAQQKTSREQLEKKIGTQCEVLIENISFDNKYFIGRTMQDVPDIDGLVYIKNDGTKKENQILNTYKKCKITDVSNYDLIAVFE